MAQLLQNSPISPISPRRTSSNEGAAMAWKCSCGILNSDHSARCTTCGTPKGLARTSPSVHTPSGGTRATATYPKPKKSATDWIWPKVTDLELAKEASRQGFWAAIVVSAVTSALAVLGHLGFQILGFNLWALIDAALFAIIASGIYRMSRTAAVAGLGLYLIEKIHLALTHGAQAPVATLIFTLMFINSIRGTFAYRRFI